MRAGRLNTLAKFHEPQSISNGGGGRSVEWINRFNRRAHFEARPQSSADIGASGGSVRNSADYLLVVRIDEFTKTIAMNWRVTINDRIFVLGSLSTPDLSRGDIRMVVTEKASG